LPGGLGLDALGIELHAHPPEVSLGDLNVDLCQLQALLMEGEMLLPSKELLLHLHHYHHRSHGLRGRRSLSRVKNRWSAIVDKSRQLYLLCNAPQWKLATVRIQRWEEQLEPSPHGHLPPKLFFDIAKKTALTYEHRQRRTQPLKTS
jgi:hypothetical protein